MTVKKEFTNMIKKIVILLSEFDKEFTKDLIPILEKLLNSGAEILEILTKDIGEIAKALTFEQRNKWLITSLLSIIHDEDTGKKPFGLQMLNNIIDLIDTEVCEVFILPEVLAMSQGDNTSKFLAIEIIPLLTKSLKSADSINKLVESFILLCSDANFEVRLACVMAFKRFTDCEDFIQIEKLQPLYKEMLRDKNKKVRHKACLQLGPLIHSTNAPFPHSLVDMYLKLAKNASNDKDLQLHCAFYFPAVLEKMGKNSWDVLSETYIFLAFSNDFPCKKSIAASLHQVAKILDEKATTEIFPILISYINNKSLRETVMKNLDQTLACFEFDSRVLILDAVKGLSKDKNFRVRAELAEKVGKISVLLKAPACFKDFWPICKSLCLDSIGHVRTKAITGIGACAVHIMENAPEYSNELIKDLKKFSNSATGLHRIVFAAACENLVDLVEFEVAFGDDFKKIVVDKVPAVRIFCAKVAKKAKKVVAISNRAFWVEAYEKLKIDEDRDVRVEINDQEFVNGVIKAGESTQKLLIPMVRSSQTEAVFAEVWESDSTDLGFFYLESELRPSHTGYVENLSFTVLV